MNESKKKKPPKASTSRLMIIDAHTHTEFSGKLDKNRGVSITQGQYFEEWRRAGVVAAVAHAHSGEPSPDLRDHNVMSCVGIDAKPDVSLMEEGLRSGKYGCIKIYLGYVHQYAYDTHYEPAYELAEKYDVPVVFHTGDTDSARAKLKYADPLTIDEVAVDHPKVRFVIAHCGNPWIESAAEVAYKNPNVYLDGSALLIGNLDRMPRAKVEEYVVRPLAWVFGYLEDPAKLMFGSDWPLTDINSYVKAFKRAIPRKHWKAVFHDNAARVFKLKLAKD
ncbi:MAG: amidohydrolase family protein [Acidobacteriota bacterium]